MCYEMSKFLKLINSPKLFFNDSLVKNIYLFNKYVKKTNEKFRVRKKHSHEDFLNLLYSSEIPVIKHRDIDGFEVIHGVMRKDAYKLIALLSQVNNVAVYDELKLSYVKASLKLILKRFLTRNSIKLMINDSCFIVFIWTEKGNCLESSQKYTNYKKLYKDEVKELKSKGRLDIDEWVGVAHRAHFKFPIDVVYTWVNHNDPKWKKELKKFSKHDNNETVQSDLDRFYNRDELRYSLRSLEVNAPWLRNIYIVTNCDPPEWLNLNNPRINIVEHSEIIDENYLPTFNSHAIECCLHKIKNISNEFIYLNDDFFFWNTVKPSDYFLSNGISISNLEGYGTVSGTVDNNDPDYLNAARNGQEILRKKFNINATRLHCHSPYALKKDVLMEMNINIRASFEKTLSSRFRSIDDISVTSFLYHHYAFSKGACVNKKVSNKYIGKSTRKTKIKNVKTICFNDGGNSFSDNKWEEYIMKQLKMAFPEKSSFEY